MEVSGKLHVPAALPPVTVDGTHWIGGYVASRESTNFLENKKIERFVVPTALILRTCYSL